MADGGGGLVPVVAGGVGDGVVALADGCGGLVPVVAGRVGGRVVVLSNGVCVLVVVIAGVVFVVLGFVGDELADGGGELVV